MKREIDIAQKQILRGRILAICDELNATGAGVPLLHALLKKFNAAYTREDIAGACRYLEEKSLVKFRHVRSDALDIERDIAYITPDGVDFLEGTTAVDGII